MTDTQKNKQMYNQTLSKQSQTNKQINIQKTDRKSKINCKICYLIRFSVQVTGYPV